MTSNAISNLAGATGYQMSAPKAQQNAEQSFSDMLRQTAPRQCKVRQMVYSRLRSR